MLGIPRSGHPMELRGSQVQSVTVRVCLELNFVLPQNLAKEVPPRASPKRSEDAESLVWIERYLNSLSYTIFRTPALHNKAAECE